MEYMWYERRTCNVGRKPKPKRISFDVSSIIERFYPDPICNEEEVEINAAEIEALRLVYIEKKSQKEAGKIMGVSNATVWRLVKSGREKLIKAIIDGRPIVVLK